MYFGYGSDAEMCGFYQGRVVSASAPDTGGAGGTLGPTRPAGDGCVLLRPVCGADCDALIQGCPAGDLAEPVGVRKTADGA